jgi:hypothetical protein
MTFHRLADIDEHPRYSDLRVATESNEAVTYPSLATLREQTTRGFLVLARDQEPHGSRRSGERAEAEGLLSRFSLDIAFDALGIEQRFRNRQLGRIVRHEHDAQVVT